MRSIALECQRIAEKQRAAAAIESRAWSIFRQKPVSLPMRDLRRE